MFVQRHCLFGTAGTPMPKPLTEAEYQLKLNPPGLPGLKINKTRAEDKIKGWEKKMGLNALNFMICGPTKKSKDM